MSYLVDSDWLIDAFLGVPTAVNLLAQLRGDGLAVSIVSYGELFEGAVGAPDPAAELARFRRFLARLALLIAATAMGDQPLARYWEVAMPTFFLALSLTVVVTCELIYRIAARPAARIWHPSSSR